MIIAVVNQKGGCGKTTTAVNLSACLAQRGERVLLIDLDQQFNATLALGAEPGAGRDVHALLTEEGRRAREMIQPTGIFNLEMIPSSLRLSGMDLDLAGKMGREVLLRRSLEEEKPRYDFIVMDCAPSLSLLTVNALAAADEVLIPVQTHYFALEGMKLLFKTINIVRKSVNAKLSVLGLLPTFYDRRSLISRDVLEGLRDFFGRRVLKTVIRTNAKLAEAPSAALPISFYAPRSRGARDYEELAEEILEFVGREETVRAE
ncbi:MAG TPA: ParA family protein [bacterium]|nr:ParA family protein [bacterium]HPQ66759.1 ParA family protein [bacterium]